MQLPKLHRIIVSILIPLFALFLWWPSNEPSERFTVGQRYQLPALPGQSIKPVQQANKQNIRSIQPRQRTKKTLSVLPSLALTQESLSPGTIKRSKVKSIVTDTNVPSVKISWQTARVRSGDSLARILKRLGFSARVTYAVSTAQGEYSQLLTKLDVGDELRIGSGDNGALAALEYPMSKTETLFINKIGDQYQSRKEIKTVEKRESFSYGTIVSSFWSAGLRAGLSDAQIINFADIFGWDIDFALYLREGDSFHFIFEKKYVDGEYIGTGNILSAEFVNRGEVFQAVRFTDNEYYTPKGTSMRKAFLRAPVNFRYISSNFKSKRFHPIQKRWKAHRGTDYSAKTGTPVVASGNGKVLASTYNKYNGHYVFIQHGNGIVTKYLHFSKRAVKKGQRVKQGQVIGYVGSTGMSQAPHLHYEFLLNGVHRNPRTVKLPDANPIAKKYRTEFLVIAQQRLLTLAGAKNALLATNQQAADKSILTDD